MKETIGYIFIFIIASMTTYNISSLMIISNKYLKFATNCIISLIVPNLIFIIVFYKSKEFKYFENIIKDRFKKNMVTINRKSIKSA